LRGFNTSGYADNVPYLNDGGRRFLNIAGSVVGRSGPGSITGIPLDADLDGDQDIILGHNTYYVEGTPLETTVLQLIRNDSQVGNWVEIRLEGTESNRSAIGGRAEVFCGANSYHQMVANGANWGVCQPPLPMHFGLDQAAAVDSVLVTWPNGGLEKWAGPPVNARVVFIEGEGEIRSGM
jgi:hypothetical protein